MNTAIYTQSMGSQGVGFAMPSNIAHQRLQHAHRPGAQGHPRLHRHSVPGAPSRQRSAACTATGDGGVIVGPVVPDGGAAKAGLQPGDVIVSIDGRHIKDGDDLVNDISARKVGSSVKLGYLRDGKPNTATVAIGDRAKTYDDLAGKPTTRMTALQRPKPIAGQSKLGITVGPVRQSDISASSV